MAVPQLSSRCEMLTRAVSALERLASPKYAAKWDNVGLLIDAVQPVDARQKYTVFLCNDLTPAVLDEAVSKRADLVVTYHPTPFIGQKQFQLSSVPSRIILTCASRNIAVYSPHTAWDVTPSGLNEWLVTGIAAAASRPVATLLPVKKADDPVAAANGYGDGRVAELSSASNVADIVAAVKSHLGLSRVQLALPTHLQGAVAEARRALGDAGIINIAKTLPVNSIAVCAGSGSGVLPGCKASVYVTGEMGHHEVLAACHAGTSVILTGHSNCERGFLPVIAERLKTALAEDGSNVGKDVPVEVLLSTVDCDPLYAL